MTDDPSLRPTPGGQFFEPWDVDDYPTIPKEQGVRGSPRMKGHKMWASVPMTNYRFNKRVCDCVNALAGVDLDNLTEVQRFALVVLRGDDLAGAKALIDYLAEK